MENTTRNTNETLSECLANIENDIATSDTPSSIKTIVSDKNHKWKLIIILLILCGILIGMKYYGFI